MSVNQNPRYRRHTSPDAEEDIDLLMRHFHQYAYNIEQPRELPDKDVTTDVTLAGARLLTTGKTLRNWVEKRTHERSIEENWARMADSGDRALSMGT
jgi:hypothetical protein